MVRRYLFLVMLFLAGCITPPTGQLIFEDVPYYEVTEHDIYDLFDKNMIISEQVTVKGVRLGDNLLEVLRAFESDSYMEQYPKDDITNVRYVNEKNKTTVIFHLVANKVERIAIREGMREELVGRTAERTPLRNLTLSFGKPDQSVDVKDFRIYTYEDKGLEIYHKRKKMFGFGLILSNQ